MTAPPRFLSDQDYVERLSDVEFWWPFVASILTRHLPEAAASEVCAGQGGTYPTILVDDYAVKLFGHFQAWRHAFRDEHTALKVVSSDALIAAPSLLASGSLFDGHDNPWPYLVTSRVPGVALPEADLTLEERRLLAKHLGAQIKHVQRLEPQGLTTVQQLPALDYAAAAARSSLPSHLVPEVEGFLARLGPFNPVFVHGDLFERHIIVDRGRLSGIIDWGDALVTDRHYELAKLYLDSFDCDKGLLRTFLEAADWPVEKNFPQMALGLALVRQATGLIQHLSNDTFHRLPANMPLQDIETLDELAVRLFEL